MRCIAFEQGERIDACRLQSLRQIVPAESAGCLAHDARLIGRAGARCMVISQHETEYQ
jgi:hypothetical protein